MVQGRLGHSRIGVTLNTSSRALAGLGREAIERLGATLEEGDSTVVAPGDARASQSEEDEGQEGSS